MENFINLAKYIQKELDNHYQDFKFEVTEELNNNIDYNKNIVIVKQTSGNVYDESAQIPYQIEIITDKPKEMLYVFTDFAKNHNNKIIDTLVDNDKSEYKSFSINQNYTTPQVIQSDTELGLQHVSRLVMFANLFIMFNINNVKLVKINGEKQEFLSGSFTYTAELFSNRVSGKSLNQNNVKYAVTGFQMELLNKMSIFSQKLALIRQGKLNVNIPFDIEITKTDNTTEQYKMILVNAGFAFARAKMPSLSVAFTIAEEV